MLLLLVLLVHLVTASQALFPETHIYSRSSWILSYKEGVGYQCNNGTGGNWGPWSDYSCCSTTCGRGLRIRSRECNNPAPSTGGQPCVGDFEEVQYCNELNPCSGSTTTTTTTTTTAPAGAPTVAFIAGGNGFGNMEAYNPTGGCSLSLGWVPAGNLASIVGLINGKITYCATVFDSICEQYNPATNTWTFLTNETRYHFAAPGIMYQNKIYIADTNAEVYDGATNVWTKWIAPPFSTNYDTVMVVWKDSFIVMGSFRYYKFSFTTQSWSPLNTTSLYTLYRSPMIVLPNQNILVGGGVYSPQSSSIYNPAANTWTPLPNTNFVQGAADFVQLGSRIFLVGGLNNTAEEFNYNTNTWSTPAIPQLYAHQGYAGAVAVPATTFAGLTGGCKGMN